MGNFAKKLAVVYLALLAFAGCSGSANFNSERSKGHSLANGENAVGEKASGSATGENATASETPVAVPTPTINPTMSPTPAGSGTPGPTVAPANCTAFLGDYKPLQLIRNQAELAAINMKAGNYKLANDIVLTGSWTPIAVVNSVFDGDNFTIRNMKSNGGGLFSIVAVTIMKNVRLDNFEANLDYADPTKVIPGIGAFASMVDAATLDNIHASNGVVRGRDSAGGLVGIAIPNAGYYCGRQSNSKIINSSATNVELQTIGAGLFSGGITGEYVDHTDISGSTFSQITWRRFDTVLNKLSTSTVPVTQLAGRISGGGYP